MVRVGISRNKEVEKDGGDAGTLRNPRPGMSLWGSVVIVSAAGHPPSEVSGQPALCIVTEGGVCEGRYEFSVVDQVKGLG